MLKSITLLLVLTVAVHSSVRPAKPVNISAVNSVYTKPWYSGYLDIENNNTHMHYFYFPSQDNSSADPLLFWFNGGPGCSSLLGALYEHGPFVLNDAFGIYMNNPYGWNKKANVVYIESPAEVGFSYMDVKRPDGWNDQVTAKLNLKAVLEFFKTWPQFYGRATYLAGESYAGIYVPTLFYELHRYNLAPTEEFKVNLAGFAVGNGCTDLLECQFVNGYPRFLMSLYLDLGFISKTLYDQAELKCGTQGEELDQICEQVLDRIDQMQNGVNIYDLYRPCYENEVHGKIMKFKEMRRQALRIKRKPTDKLTWAPPCVDSLGIDSLLLDPANRKQLGIPDSVPPYSMCNIDDKFVYNRSETGSYYVYKALVPLNQYKIIIYSGDSDPAVPYTGTVYWINKLRTELKLSTVEYWRPWFTTTSNGRQNSGNLWTLNNKLKLVTFKGIGHMAPQWNYQGGFKVINNLLHDSDL